MNTTHPVSRITSHASRLTHHAPSLALFLFLLAIYLLTYSPRINSSDGLAMFSTAESIVRRGALDIEQIRWMGLQQGTYGLDGLLYSRKGIGLPLGLLPLTWLGLAIPWFGPVSVSLLFNAIVTALTAGLLLAYLQQVGFSQGTGLIVALTFGLTTLAWPYAKSLFSDPFSGLLLLAAAYTLLKFRQYVLTNKEIDKAPLRPPAPLLLFSPADSKWPSSIKYLLYPFLAGLFLGWNVTTRYAEILFLPLFGMLLLYYLGTRAGKPSSRLYRLKLRVPAISPWPPILAFSTPLLLIGLALIIFNIARYGDPFNTGYLPNETFSAILWQGILGQLVSPGRGLLLYCPVLILSFWGLPAAWRHFRAETLLALSVIIIHLLLYGKWFMWHGGFAWGPRFMIPTLPFWVVFLAPVVARAFPSKRWQVSSEKSSDPKTVPDDVSDPIKNDQDLPGLLLRIAFITLALLGLIPQLLTVTIDFTPFQGALLDTGLPLFAPQTFFDPQYAPLLKAWTFITRDTLDLAWAWQGHFNGWLLAVLAFNISITGLHLKKQAGAPSEQVSHPTNHSSVRSLPVGPLPLLSTLITLIFLLTYTHTLPGQPLQQAIAVLNESVRPTDVVITNGPEVTMPLAELYKGHAPVLGLNNGGFPLPEDVTRRLAETMGNHQQVWWLPNWLPFEESAVEQTLLSAGFRARNDNFDGQRLALFAFPHNLVEQNIAEVTFENLIRLDKVSYPPSASPGAAFPVKLHWQATGPIAEDYHVFIHLLTSEGRIVTQADGQPVLWTRPTSTWKNGEIIIDRYGLWIPSDTTAGLYQLLVGLYRPADGQRLRLSNEADSVKLKVTVQ